MVSGGKLRRFVAIYLIPALLCLPAAIAQEDAECFFCHNEPELTKDLPDGTTKSLFVDEQAYADNVH